MAEPEVIAAVKKYLENLAQNGLTVAFAVIFGSQVTGNANDLSDIDLIVVSPQFNKQHQPGHYQ